MLEKDVLKDVLERVIKKAHSDEIVDIIKNATLDLNAKILMQTMIDLHREVLEEMGYDGVDGLLDCMEAIDHNISDQEIASLVVNIRKKFGQE
jgi:hypothetical protein